MINEQEFLTYVYCTKSNGNNISYPDVKKSIFSIKIGVNSINVSYTGLHKRLWIHYVIWLEITGSMFSIELYIFSFIVFHFSVHFDAYTIHNNLQGYSNRVTCINFRNATFSSIGGIAFFCFCCGMQID